MKSVVLHDKVAEDPEMRVVMAEVPIAQYAELCATMGCAEGDFAATLLKRVQADTDVRHQQAIMLYVREVQKAGRLAELASMMADGGSLAYLKVKQ